MRRQSPEFTTAKPRPPGADFADYCCELLGSLGDVQAKRMFGGYGLSVDGLTVAIIAWETLYLKVNPDTEAQWQAAGCQIFEWETKDKVMRMAYYTAPEAALESRAAMQPWAQLALQAAVAARAKAAPKRRRDDSGKVAGATKTVKTAAKKATRKAAPPAAAKAKRPAQ